MKVTLLADAERRPRRVAVGTFDGVHLGHRQVIAGADTVVTFEPHPRTVVAPGAVPPLLCSPALKRDLIADLGVQELVVIPFDREFASREARDFIDDVLVARLDARSVAVGENFRFGRAAGGDAALLAAERRFTTTVVPLVEVDGETVSSTQIRGLVAAGEVGPAARFLGAPFALEGQVAHGDARGRTLGMPTANLVPDSALAVPGHGVYAAWVTIEPDEPGERASPWPGDRLRHPAAVNVGVRPMFDSARGLLIEAHLIGFAGDLYDRTIRVAFLERLRGERRFPSVDALVEQMRRDVDEAARIASATVIRR